MPKKLSTNQVKKEFLKYGYIVPTNFQYNNYFDKIRVFDEQNNIHVDLNLQQLRYRVKNGRSPYFNKDLMNLPVTGNEPRDTDPFTRFKTKYSDALKEFDGNERTKIYSSFQNFMNLVSRQKDFRLEFNGDERSNFLSVQALNIVLQEIAPRLANKDVRLTLTDMNNNITFAHFNPHTISLLNSLFSNDKNDFGDSDSIIINELSIIKSINFSFIDRAKGTRQNPGFFPFQNKTDIDLSRFGIFSDLKNPKINDSCLIQAFESSGILNENEMKFLRSIIKTRTVPRTELKKIADLLKVQIDCTIYYFETGKTSHTVFAPKELSHEMANGNYNRSIKLIVVFDHYLLNERVKVSLYYCQHFDEMNKRFCNNKNKRLLYVRKDGEVLEAVKPITIFQVIKALYDNNYLVPWNSKDASKLTWGFKQSTDNSFNFMRLIQVPDRYLSYYAAKKERKAMQTKHFFGYAPDPNEIEERLSELQTTISKLGVKVNVRLYYKFSELMQKVMQEYGCFEGVYESCGQKADEMRSNLIFPKTRTFNDKPLYLSGKYYYIDLNGAYLSCIDSIPSGKDDGYSNGKVKELVKKMYEFRQNAKDRGMNKLATTLKFMVNSSWGYSIRRPKIMKNKYSKNIEKYTNEFAPYVAKFNYINKKAGFVTTVNSVVPHYTCPQFAKKVLDNYFELMNKVKGIVTVYYENIDAILVNESDYNKLKDLGFIGTELGKFKIEKVFSEIAILTQKKYVGKLEDGSVIRHLVKNDVDYNNFVEEVKSYC